MSQARMTFYMEAIASDTTALMDSSCSPMAARHSKQFGEEISREAGLYHGC